MNTLNAAPKAIVRGIRDLTGGPDPVIAAEYPTHLPHVVLFAREGSTVPQLVTGAQATEIFGAETFDLNGNYANHQTVLANYVMSEANKLIIQRVVPTDANGPAKLALALEVVADELPVYERNADGTFKLDATRQKIDTGTTISGHRLKWMVAELPSGIGSNTKLTGAMTGAGGQESTVYPILDLEVSSFGEHGNHKGLSLWAPTANDLMPANVDVMEDNRAYVYRVKMLKRANARSTPNTVETLRNARSVDFSFREDVMNKATEAKLGFDKVFLDSWRDLKTDPRKYGNFNEAYLYRDNLEEVLALLYTAEQAAVAANGGDTTLWVETPEDGEQHMINIMSGKHWSGVPYHTIHVEGAEDGGITLTETTPIYAKGGSDGTINHETYNTFCTNLFNGIHSSAVAGFNFLDDAMWPTSVFYDSGVRMDTKKAMVNVIKERKDIMVVLSTQDVEQTQNSSLDETSTALALYSALMLAPESAYWGTPVTRAMIIGGSGKLINSAYTGILPITVEFAQKSAAFMGASNGVWKENMGYDMPGEKIVKLFDVSTVNEPWKPQGVYDNDWDLGLVWPQTFNRTQLHFPQTQTVYSDAKSVLNVSINVWIAIEAQKKAKYVWRYLTGNAKWSFDRFAEESDRLLAELLYSERFDNRVQFKFETYQTDTDKILGSHWSTRITLYLNNGMTVNTIDVESDYSFNFDG